MDESQNVRDRRFQPGPAYVTIAMILPRLLPRLLPYLFLLQYLRQIRVPLAKTTRA